MAARGAGPAPEALIDLVIARAPRLRDAGVLQVQIGEIVVVLAPAAPAPAPKSAEQEQIELEEQLDPLDRPSTYGRRNGTPGFSRPPAKKEEE